MSRNWRTLVVTVTAATLLALGLSVLFKDDDTPGKTSIAAEGVTPSVSSNVKDPEPPPEQPSKAKPQPKSKVRPVVVLVFDEFASSALLSPEGEIQKNRFPNFHDLARKSDFYPNSASVADMTFRAVPAIMTGRKPDEGLIPDHVDHPRNLFFALHRKGFRVKSREILTEMCPAHICGLERQGNVDRSEVKDPFDFSKKKVAALTKEVERETRPYFIWDLADFVGKGANGKLTSSFTFAHFLTPHEPYMYLPTGQIYDGGHVPEIRTPGDSILRFNQNATDAFLQRYVLQVGYADFLVGQVVQQLKKAGVWEQTTLVVTGDHGVAIEPGKSRRIASEENIGAIAATPLFVKFPYQKKGRRSAAMTSTVDIAPTIYRILGMNPYPTDGKPVRSVTRDRLTLTGLQNEVTFTRSQIRSERKRVSNTYRRALGDKGIWKLGPKPDLVGRNIKAVRNGPASASVDQIEQFTNVDPLSDIVPAFINGTLKNVAPGEVLAIVVNGKIAGTTRAFVSGGEVMFSCVIKPSFLRNGKNQVTVTSVH